MRRGVDIDLQWFTQQFTNKHPDLVGTSHEAIARLWFLEGLDRQLDFQKEMLAEIRAEVDRILQQLQ